PAWPAVLAIGLSSAVGCKILILSEAKDLWLDQRKSSQRCFASLSIGSPDRNGTVPHHVRVVPVDVARGRMLQQARRRRAEMPGRDEHRRGRDEAAHGDVV